MFDYLSFKKFQYGYHGKNGKVSDQTERTYWEYYSNRLLLLGDLGKLAPNPIVYFLLVV